jgi:BclB C-terminal domain-containing protein
LVGLPSIVGFSDNFQLPTVLGATIDLTGLTDLTFMVPRDGTITSLSAFFSVTVGLSVLGSDINVTAQLYSANPASNTLSLLPGSQVTLTPPLSGLISIGDVTMATQALNIPVTAGTRLALIISIDVTGVAIATTLIGTVSAGLAIA